MNNLTVSIFNGKVANQTQYVDQVIDVNWSDLGSNITKYSWSPFEFNVDPEKNRPHRHKSRFKKTRLLVFDVDGGLSIKSALNLLAGHKAMIGTTKSHGIEKVSGSITYPACDRYRVIIELSEDIVDPEIYKATWLDFSKKLGVVDEQCKDVARFYFPCAEIVYISDGKTIDPVHPVITKLTEKGVKSLKKTKVSYGSTIKFKTGRLFPSTNKFIAQGADHNWHGELLKAAMDLKEQNFTQEHATTILETATFNYLGHLDDHDLNVIKDVFNNRGGKHQFRENFSTVEKPSVVVVFRPQTEEQLLEQFKSEISRRKKSMARTFTFMSSAFDRFIRLESAALTLIGAKTGQGKTTCNLNLVVALLRESNFTKKILIVSNEESLAETYSKIACLFLNINWKTDYKGLKNPTLEEVVAAAVKEIQKTVTVVTSDDKYDTTNLEDVKSILTHAQQAEDKYAVVIIDYLQTITSSKNPNLTFTWQVSKDLGSFLKKYAQTCDVPVIVFSQLKEATADNKDLASRVQNDKTFANHCHTLLEVVPDFKNQTTNIICHKQRWGNLTNWKVTVLYEKGILKPCDSFHV